MERRRLSSYVDQVCLRMEQSEQTKVSSLCKHRLMLLVRRGSNCATEWEVAEVLKWIDFISRWKDVAGGEDETK